MSQAGLERSHRLRCDEKIRFESKDTADNYAVLLGWANPGTELEGMDGFKCTSCTGYHIGHAPRGSRTEKTSVSV